MPTYDESVFILLEGGYEREITHCSGEPTIELVSISDGSTYRNSIWSDKLGRAIAIDPPRAAGIVSGGTSPTSMTATGGTVSFGYTTGGTANVFVYSMAHTSIPDTFAIKSDEYTATVPHDLVKKRSQYVFPRQDQSLIAATLSQLPYRVWVDEVIDWGPTSITRKLF